MLLIRTYIAPSAIPGAGMGLFCAEPVKAGTLVWQFMPGLDYEVHELPENEIARAFVLKYGYMPLEGPRRWVMCVDDARFFNHADDPTCIETDNGTAARFDLPSGTELTTDYREFARDPFAGFGAKQG
jgi:hypothetical protein